MKKKIFTYVPPKSAYELSLTMISLEEWSLVTISGIDSFRFLQGQLTIDLTKIKKNKHYQCAHCNSHGLMWSNLLLFYYNDNLAWIERRSIHELQISALKKYAIFDDVTISVNKSAILIGLAGHDAGKALKSIFSLLPNEQNPVVHNNETTLLWFQQPSERFLIITNMDILCKLEYEFKKYKLKFNNSNQWLTLDIQSGLPIIDINHCGKFIPQAANLEYLNAISFNKGCYIGQETIAKIKFRGINKRALYWLKGHTNLDIFKKNYSFQLFYQDKWENIKGTILAFCIMLNGEIWIQAILDKKIFKDNLLRFKEDKCSKLLVQELPYSL
ncbi:MAG: tRNA-modifying protein YgfZ [Candidatus Dasytiphilus stammeri]